MSHPHDVDGSSFTSAKRMFGFDRMSNETCRNERVLLSKQAPKGDLHSASFSSGENQVLRVVFPRTSENYVAQDRATYALYFI
jgi:hypothetical protein